jgi:tetratricopeptide (TPR) repeat protein
MDNPLVAEDGVRALATALGLIARYAGIALFPWGLSNDYSGSTVAIETTLLAWRPLLGLALAAAAVAIAVRGRTVALAVAIAGLPYLLVANLVVPVGAILAERFLYLPLAGVCLLAAAGIARYGRIAERAAAAAVAILAVLMLIRAIDWKDDATIFAATARHNPKSPRAPFWLGSLAVEAGRPEVAAPHFDAAIRNWPAFAPAWLAKGVLLARAGDGTGAARTIGEAIRLEPGWAAPHLNLALVLHRAGERVAALRSARKAALLDPQDATAWAEIGHLAFETGDFRRAAGAYERAVARGRTDLAGRLAEARARL